MIDTMSERSMTWATFASAIGVALVILYGIFSLVSRIPVCVQSHLENVHVADTYEMRDIYGLPWMGNGVPFTHWTPAHDEVQTRCDAWESPR